MTLINRSAFVSDLLDILRDCLGDDCKYKFLQSRGLPPLECNYVAVSFGDHRIEHFEDCSKTPSCGSWISEYDIHVYLALGDLSMLVSRDMDFELENDVAICFNDDVTQLESCLLCADYTDLIFDFNAEGLQFVSTRIHDHGAGAFVATILLRLRVNECCPVP